MLFISSDDDADSAKALAASLGAVFMKARILTYPSSGEVKIEIDQRLVKKFKKIYIFHNSTSASLHKGIYAAFLIIYKIRNLGINDINLIMPYAPYSRSIDSFNYFLFNIANLGVKKFFTLDLHDPGSARDDLKINLINIPTSELFARSLRNFDIDYVIAPDSGSCPRAMQLADFLSCKLAILNKIRRLKGDVFITNNHLEHKNLEGKTCVIFDDIIDTGKTILAAIDFLKLLGVANIMICSSHFLCSKDAYMQIIKTRQKLIGRSPIFITDSALRSYSDFLDSRLAVIYTKSLIRQHIIENL